MKAFSFRLKTFSLISSLVLVFAFDISAQVNYSESFDGTPFPTNGWTTTGPTSLWVQRTNGTNPTCTPHSGAAMARFSAFNQTPGVQDEFVSPVVDFSGNTGNIPTFSMWVYRDGNSTAGDSVTVFVNTSTALTGATRIGAVARSRFFVLPVNETSDGWYQYTFNVPSTVSADTNYFILRGTSRDGGNIYIDDVSWIAYPTPCSGNPAAGTLTVDRTLLCGGSGDANLTLLGATANLSGISYNWQSGPAATGPWTNFGQDDTIVNTGTLTSSTYFRCYVSCVPSGISDTSAVVLVTVNSNPIPVVSVTPNTNVIYCTASAPVVLVASGSNSYVWTPDIAIPNGVGDSALAAPGVNTTYTIVGTDTTGCFASTTVNVQARISPNVNGTTNNNTICDGASTNLQASIIGPGFGIQFQWNPGALNGANQTVSPSTTTSYVISATSPQSGCVGRDTVLITVNPANVASFTYSVVNQTVTFVDASTGATSWLWDFGDGTTSTLQSPGYTYGSNGVYIVSLIVDNGLCPADTFTQTIIVGPASIQTLNDPTDLILFPNPASGPVTIVFVSESNRAEIFIVNQLGQIVQETEAFKGPENLFTVELETSKLAKGAYQIKVVTEKELRLHTFIKK